MKEGNAMIYDVLILGAGPAGLAAAIYAGRNNQSVLLIEKRPGRRSNFAHGRS